jgi:diguanylate cyclase (GGDEF)-like protein
MHHFTEFNDRFGHLVGDELLRALSGTIRTGIRYSTGKPSYELDIPCRYGGDEFAIIAPETNPAQAMIMAERLRKEIRMKCGRGMMAHIQGAAGSRPLEPPEVTVSVGVAGFPEHATDAEALVKAADDAMYASKRSERNTVVVSEASPCLESAGRAG